MSIARRSVGWLAALPLLGISSALSPVHANQSRVEADLSNIITLQRPGQDGLATIWEKNKYVQCWLQPDRALRCEAGGTLMQPSLVRILSPERIARLIMLGWTLDPNFGQYVRIFPAELPVKDIAERAQYVARPPEMSNTAPVENEHSSDASQHTSAATSSTCPSRPIGIFDTM